MESTRELIVPSHFDYENQALLYVPPGTARAHALRSSPPRPPIASGACWKLRQGRAFCLFTSYAQMHDVHDRLLGELEYPDAVAGDGAANPRCSKNSA